MAQSLKTLERGVVTAGLVVTWYILLFRAKRSRLMVGAITGQTKVAAT